MAGPTVKHSRVGLDLIDSMKEAVDHEELLMAKKKDTRPANYSCPEDGAYLLDDPNNPGWKKCPGCKFRRKKL